MSKYSNTLGEEISGSETSGSDEDDEDDDGEIGEDGEKRKKRRGKVLRKELVFFFNIALSHF